MRWESESPTGGAILGIGKVPDHSKAQALQRQLTQLSWCLARGFTRAPGTVYYMGLRSPLPLDGALLVGFHTVEKRWDFLLLSIQAWLLVKLLAMAGHYYWRFGVIVHQQYAGKWRSIGIVIMQETVTWIAK